MHSEQVDAARNETRRKNRRMEREGEEGGGKRRKKGKIGGRAGAPAEFCGPSEMPLSPPFFFSSSGRRTFRAQARRKEEKGRGEGPCALVAASRPGEAPRGCDSTRRKLAVVLPSGHRANFLQIEPQQPRGASAGTLDRLRARRAPLPSLAPESNALECYRRTYAFESNALECLFQARIVG